MAVDAVRANSLFLAASDLADPAERAAFLDREREGGAELRARRCWSICSSAPDASASPAVVLLPARHHPA